ncbi:MAG: hypothetical protein JNG85_12250 [Spirochaetaceae bacterium]|nr:hypothetical protein [Spirochaetaceae bacterium]
MNPPPASPQVPRNLAASPAAAPAVSPAEGGIPKRRVLGMLALRPALSFALLLALAGFFASRGAADPVGDSAAWWLWLITATNAATLFLLVRLGGKEGLRLRDFYSASKASWRGDLGWTLVAFAGIAVTAQLPGDLLAKALWGTPSVPNNLLFRPLPLFAVYPLFLLMPATQALAELPLYWGYVAPRLRAGGMARWKVIALVGATLSFQHLCFSFRLDWRYDLWLALKFLPFALWTGFVLERRPTAMPYLMGAHFAADAGLPVLAFLVSRGMIL